MHESLDQEWRRLAENYAQMWDDELLNLAADYKDLTDMAKQLLRDEMKKRRLRDPSAPFPVPAEPVKRPPGDQAAIHWESYQRWRGPDVPPRGDEDRPREYSWKVRLCECEDLQHAWQAAEWLRRNGIDTWIDAQESRYSGKPPVVSVAADQLDQARAVLEQPIPQDIIDESHQDASAPEYFETPACPFCGAVDPLLCPAEELSPDNSMPDGVEWGNTWQCESCGKEWSDSPDES